MTTTLEEDEAAEEEDEAGSLTEVEDEAAEEVTEAAEVEDEEASLTEVEEEDEDEVPPEGECIVLGPDLATRRDPLLTFPFFSFLLLSVEEPELEVSCRVQARKFRSTKVIVVV